MAKKIECPFCGGRMNITAEHYYDQHGDWWKGYYYCLSCSAEGPKSYGALTPKTAMERATERGIDVRAFFEAIRNL